MSSEQRGPRVATSDLHGREFWTPAQCARVLGRGADYWRIAYDNGDVEGYDEVMARKRRRYLSSASARGHLQARCARVLVQPDESGADREVVSRFLSTQAAR
jgi:hypothetical protein